MISKSNVFEKHCDHCDNGFFVIFFKTIIRFGFCDIRNNQGRGKCYQPKPKAEADNTNTETFVRFVNQILLDLLIKVEVSVISRSRRLRLITLTPRP